MQSQELFYIIGPTRRSPRQTFQLEKNWRVVTGGIKTCVRRGGGIGFIGIRLSLVVPFSSPTPRLARIENQCLDNIGQNPLSEKTFKFRSCGNRSNSVKNMVLQRKLERARQIRRTSYTRLNYKFYKRTNDLRISRPSNYITNIRKISDGKLRLVARLQFVNYSSCNDEYLFHITII